MLRLEGFRFLIFGSEGLGGLGFGVRAILGSGHRVWLQGFSSVGFRLLPTIPCDDGDGALVAIFRVSKEV